MCSSHFHSFPSFSERSEESTNSGAVIQATASNMDPSPTFHSGSGSDGVGSRKSLRFPPPLPSFSERSEEPTNSGTVIQTTALNMDPSPTFHSGSGSDGGGWNYCVLIPLQFLPIVL
ncbi:hypothetical protein GCM10027567_09870 [Spongiibacter taiwanensis]